MSSASINSYKSNIHHVANVQFIHLTFNLSVQSQHSAFHLQHNHKQTHIHAHILTQCSFWLYDSLSVKKETTLGPQSPMDSLRS